MEGSIEALSEVITEDPPQALQAVHGAVHAARVGLKYTWFGAGYISNMYYKWIANYATYDFEKGGGLDFNKGFNVRLYAKGDNEGKPRNQTGGN